MVIQSSARRIVLAFLVAVVLAAVLLATKTASAQVHVPSGCKGLTPSDPAYWIRHCYLYPAVQPPFLVRVR